ncbi:hypothetical protein ABZ772_24175, partial [Streptomyces griseoincarnatus]
MSRLHRAPRLGTGLHQHAQRGQQPFRVRSGQVGVQPHPGVLGDVGADSWTGTPEALAERILAAVSLTDTQADQIVAA